MPQFEKFGQYVLLEELSSYYFGKSYRAARITDTEIGDHIILLKINSELTENHEFIKNLQDEIGLCMDLDDPNILKTLGMGKTNNTFYITRQFTPGQPLKNVLQMCATRDVRFSTDHAVFTGAKLCRILEFTHAHEAKGKKLIHGNLSTTSVILSYDGQVNLSGFGLTSILLYLPEWKERILLRKDEYLSPEQMTGRQIDHRSDIFTAGVILFEMLTGDPFFLPGRGINLKTRIDSVRVGKAGAASDRISDGIVHVLENSIVSDPGDRYQSIKEMRIDLETSLITDNYHASTSTLGTALGQLFSEEITAKQKQWEKERQFDLSGFLADHEFPADDVDEEVIEDVSGEKISVRIEKTDLPSGETPEEGISVMEEKALAAGDEDAVDPRDTHPKKRDFFSRISTPILVVGLLIILLLIVFYFILGRSSGGPDARPKDRVSLQAPGERQIRDAWKGYHGSDVAPPLPAASSDIDRQAAAERHLEDDAPPLTGGDPVSADQSASQAPEKAILPDPEPAGPVDREDGADLIDPGIEGPDASPDPAPQAVIDGETDLNASPVTAETENAEAAGLSPEDGIEESGIQHISDLDLRTSGDILNETLAVGPDETAHVEFPVEIPAEPVMPEPEVVEPPVMAKYYPPVYSSLARQLKIRGVLQLDLLISESGKVLETEIAQTPQNRALDRAGVVRSVTKAAAKWEFQPATRDGEAFEKWHRINFRVSAE
jgi:serine/threonine-protein kinase